MTCNDCQDELIDFAHGELDATRDAAVAGHLGSCPGCALEYCRLVADLRGIAAVHVDAAPRPEVAVALRSRVARLVAPPLWRRAIAPLGVRVPLYGALVAAAIPVALWLGAMRSPIPVPADATQIPTPPTLPTLDRYDATRTPAAFDQML